MAFIEMVGSDVATGETGAVYETARTSGGFVPDATRAFSARPELMAGLEAFKGHLVRGASTLPRLLEDLIAVYVGRLNRNSYVSLSHAEALRSAGAAPEQILRMTADLAVADLSELERAVLRLAEKLTQRSDGSSEGDIQLLREHGLDDRQIVDVVAAIAFWNFQTRVLSALGVTPEPWRLERADPALIEALSFPVSRAGTPAEAAARGRGNSEQPVELADVGTKLLYSNELVNVWEVALRPGEIQPWHTHRHPYLVVSLDEGTSRITQYADGSARDVEEQRGHVVFRAAGDVHNLQNIGDTPTVTRLIELKTAPAGSWAPAYIVPTDPFADEFAAATPSTPAPPKGGRASSTSREVLISALSDEGFERVNKVPGERSKLLWSRAAERGQPVQDDASIHMVRFSRGSGIPSVHAHASNQFMFCLSGRYLYRSSGLILGPGDFYFNPRGSEHGPTEALEDTVLLEIYDGPHYVVKPDFEFQDEEKRP